MPFFKDDPILNAVALPPDAPVTASFPSTTVKFRLARIYNRLGGLMNALAAKAKMPPAAALAVWYVESGGGDFTPSQPILRFENHKFFESWGKTNPSGFDAHFQFGGRLGVSGRSFESHKWRRAASSQWTPFHGSQAAEYEVFRFASDLANMEHACRASSFGGPQILGSNHALIGYATADGLFTAFAESERAHVFGFFDFCAKGNLIRHLRAKDWQKFAAGYNGAANAAHYGRLIEDAVNSAQEVLGSLPPAPAPADAPHGLGTLFHVDGTKAQSLNLRIGPLPAAVIATLGQRHEVTRLGEHPADSGWWRVAAILDGRVLEGFVKASFLAPGPGIAPPLAEASALPAAHLRSNRNKRTGDGGRAFPLDEDGMPSRTGNTPEALAKSLVAITRYLDPAKPAHKRYAPNSSATFCNIYAYDYAMRCGVYLPRVWWTDPALARIRSGETVAVDYAVTVREVSANGICDWLADHGQSFGWRRAADLDELQKAANAGEVCFIVAQRANLNDSGHITAVIPEHAGFEAVRKDGLVTRAVESQAGESNFRAKVQTRQWWLGTKYRSFGFWMHR